MPVYAFIYHLKKVFILHFYQFFYRKISKMNVRDTNVILTAATWVGLFYFRL